MPPWAQCFDEPEILITILREDRDPWHEFGDDGRSSAKAGLRLLIGSSQRASRSHPAMRALRSSSPFKLFDRLEQQLSQHLQSAECVPPAEVHEAAETLVVVLELPGVDRSCIDVKSTGRTLVVSTGRRSTLWRPQ
jgi:hypothetical protein